jgi:hypothetical protein
MAYLTTRPIDEVYPLSINFFPHPLLSTIPAKSASGGEMQLTAWYVVRLHFTQSGVSEDASALIHSTTRKNTNAAYQSTWNFWRNLCATKEKDPLSPSSTDIVNFLAEYSVGRSYRTVNVARSTFSSTLAVDPGNVAVGVDPLVNKLLKGLYNKFPSTARYSQTWNTDTVLSYLMPQLVRIFLSLNCLEN